MSSALALWVTVWQVRRIQRTARLPSLHGQLTHPLDAQHVVRLRVTNAGGGLARAVHVAIVGETHAIDPAVGRDAILRSGESGSIGVDSLMFASYERERRQQQPSAQPSPRQLSTPSRAATAAMTKAAAGSAHHQPSSAFAPRPKTPLQDGGERSCGSGLSDPRVVAHDGASCLALADHDLHRCRGAHQAVHWLGDEAIGTSRDPIFSRCAARVRCYRHLT